jgi:Fic family protein
MKDHLWVEIQEFPALSQTTEAALKRLEPLRQAWEEAAETDPAAFQDTRLRILRSHAIETGIIEQLYDVEWGVTEALVAEGISQEVLERAGGGLERDTLAIINDQYEALEFVAEAARGERPFTVSFVRELHQLITRHQESYDATDALGRSTNPPLLHGEWKTFPNHVTRPDGSKLEYCPPERVQDQMEALVGLLAADQSHPVVRAAWLHHRFISIHPFQDGNGRVARALVLLELLRGHLAPLVVGRDVRGTYIDKLDVANDGDLEPLILLFAELERQAMIRQFQEPLRPEASGSVLDVAKAAAAKLADVQEAARKEKSQKLAALSLSINARVGSKLKAMKGELEQTFQAVDPKAHAWVQSANLGQENATHYYGQIVGLAKRHQFFANLSEGTWWTVFNLQLLQQRLRLLVATVKVGSGDTGVGEVMVAAERLVTTEDGSTNFELVIEPSEMDQVPITGELAIDDIWPDIDHLIDRCLSAAIIEFTRTLG